MHYDNTGFDELLKCIAKLDSPEELAIIYQESPWREGIEIDCKNRSSLKEALVNIYGIENFQEEDGCAYNTTNSLVGYEKTFYNNCFNIGLFSWRERSFSSVHPASLRRICEEMHVDYPTREVEDFTRRQYRRFREMYQDYYYLREYLISQTLSCINRVLLKLEDIISKNENLKFWTLMRDIYIYDRDKWRVARGAT